MNAAHNSVATNVYAKLTRGLPLAFDKCYFLDLTAV
jgi:hypothetical protein